MLGVWVKGKNDAQSETCVFGRAERRWGTRLSSCHHHLAGTETREMDCLFIVLSLSRYHDKSRYVSGEYEQIFERQWPHPLQHSFRFQQRSGSTPRSEKYLAARNYSPIASAACRLVSTGRRVPHQHNRAS
jgi:hypothetical protein